MLSIFLYASFSSIYLWRCVSSCLWSFLSWVCFLIVEFWQFFVLDKVFFFLSLSNVMCDLQIFLLSLSFFILLALSFTEQRFLRRSTYPVFWGFPGSPVGYHFTFQWRGYSFDPDWGSKISHTFQPETRTKRKQCYNKFNKGFKSGPQKKTFRKKNKISKF